MSHKIKVILVDDETPARHSLREALGQFPEIEIAGECANGFEAVQTIQKVKPHLVFLDIQMPKIDGFDVVELLGLEAPYIIFVTAFDEYALRAFEAQALDYLLKPINPERLQKAIGRVQEQLQQKTTQAMDKLIDSHHDHLTPLPRVLIRDGSDVFVIPVENITYMEAQDDYVKIYTTGKAHLKYDRLTTLESKLDSRTFCRIHRSYLLNINFLTKIEPYTKDSRIVKLKTGDTLPLSKSGYNRLLELL